MANLCQCALCKKIIELTQDAFITSCGWADPRRRYMEDSDAFLERVPDGFLRWPDDHKFFARVD